MTKIVYFTKENGNKPGIGTWLTIPEKGFHREDGPAVIFVNYGSQEEQWWIDGKMHRNDGPAIVKTDGTIRWIIQNEDKTIEVEKWIEEMSLPNWDSWDDKTKLLFKLTWC